MYTREWSHYHHRWVGHCPNMTSTVPFVAKLSHGEGRHQLFLWLRSGEVELGWHQYFNARDVYTPYMTTLHNSTNTIYVSINISLSKEKNSVHDLFFLEGFGMQVYGTSYGEIFRDELKGVDSL